MNTDLVPVAFVRSELSDRQDCPKQYTEGAPPARIEVLPEFVPAMHGLREGQDVLILTWLHQADRSYLTVHPRGDVNRPQKGVFDTRSPDRPNPIGLHRTRITSIQGATLEVDALEVLDGTPVVDIKTTGPEDRMLRSRRNQGRAPETAENWGSDVGAQAGEELRWACAEAHALGMLAGASGNASLRLGHAVVMTRSGVSKRRLLPEHLTTLDPDTGEVTGPGKPSSEWPMHMAVYREQPGAKAILHTHPPHLLALWMALGADPDGLPDLLELPLFEAKVAMGEFAVVPAMEPGTRKLADAVGRAARDKRAVFMAGHGLMVWGADLEQALTLTEELDSLAKIRLLALSTK